MKQIEASGAAHGLSYRQMMENAGQAVWRELALRCPQPGRLLVVCGKGNNGGDGFVTARAAAQAGWQVWVLLAEGEPCTPDAQANWQLLAGMPGVQLCTLDPLPEHPFTAAVDALYGTGFHGTLRPQGAAACALLERCRRDSALVFAADLPSGCNADTGAAAPGAVRADVTVTFDSCKPVHFSAPDHCGQVICADIGILDASAPLCPIDPIIKQPSLWCSASGGAAAVLAPGRAVLLSRQKASLFSPKIAGCPG